MVGLEDMLLGIFEKLRQQRVPLGLADYVLALKAVSDLADSEDLENIQSLCRLFWAKSSADQLLFDETFAIESHKQLEAIKQKEQQNAFSSSSKTTLPSRPTPPNIKPPVSEKKSPQRQPIVVPKARSQSISDMHPKGLSNKGNITYHLIPRPPMDKRDMVGVWRKLRYLQQEGVSEDLDVQATTQFLERTGFLLKPVLKNRRRNQARLVIMLDQGGSMEPFTLFISALLESILRSGSLRQVDIFYFHDAPENYLYEHSTLLGSKSLESVLLEHCQNTSVLIVSDAGAARGHYDSIRLRTTKDFLGKLNQSTYLYAWLNPVPKERWMGNTAWHIAQLLPMFQLDWEGLNDLVNVLRGQSVTGVQQL
jgi:uncharacterized protein with von Willebrand factor type A (vWA) domain